MIDPPSKLIEFLPSTPAKWVLWSSLTLSVLLYSLLLWLQVDMLLPISIAKKLSLLLPSTVLLLIGATIILFIVIKSYNAKNQEVIALKKAIKDYVTPPKQAVHQKVTGSNAWMR